MLLQTSLQTWAALRCGVVKPRTQKYHQELIECIGRRWPEKFFEDVDRILGPDLGILIGRIASLSDSRFNGIVTMLRATVPAAKKLSRRRLRLKERPLINHTEFSILLEKLDARPRSHAGLVIRFLAHTGLRINEARQIKWTDVHGIWCALWVVIETPGVRCSHSQRRPLPYSGQGILTLRGPKGN